MAGESLKYRTKIGLYWKTIEQVSLYAMQFVVGIVMARLLSPEDYGIAALPAVFMAIAQVFIDGGFGAALIRKPKVTKEDLAASFYYSFGVGVLCYIALFVGAPFIAKFYNVPILTPLIRVTALNFIWSPLQTPQSVILTRKLDFKTPARISIVNKFFSAAVGISVAYMGYGIWALVASMLTSSLMSVIQFWLAVKWYPDAGFSKESFRYLWDFGNKLIAVRILQAVYSNIAQIIIGKAGGTADLGNLSRAHSFVSLPSNYFTGMVSNITFPVLSKIQDGDDSLALKYRKMIKFSAFVCFPVMMLLCAVAKPLVIFLVTEKWKSCIILLQILCAANMFLPIQVLNLNLLQVKGRTDLTLKLEIIKKVVYFVAVVIAVQYGILTFVITDFFLSMFALVVNTYYTGKLINVGYIRQVRDFAPALTLSVLMMVLVQVLIHLFDKPLVQLLVGVVAGIVFYAGSAILFRFKEIDDALYLLKFKKK